MIQINIKFIVKFIMIMKFVIFVLIVNANVYVQNVYNHYLQIIHGDHKDHNVLSLKKAIPKVFKEMQNFT